MCTKALSGTELPYVELDCEIVEAVELFCAFPTALIPLFWALNCPAEGEYNTDVVVAFEPADEDPDEANEFVAPGPLAPEDAFD
jgi:hypothetical protein